MQVQSETEVRPVPLVREKDTQSEHVP